MQNQPIEQIVGQIETVLAQLSGQIGQTVNDLRGSIPKLGEAVDAIEGIGPGNARDLTQILRGESTVKHVFAGMPREEGTGRLIAPESSDELVTILKALVAELKQKKPGATTKEQTVGQEVRGLSWQQRQQRLVKTGDVLPIEEVQRRLLTKRIPSVKQIIGESEKAQQQLRERRQSLAEQLEQLAAAAKPAPPSRAVMPLVRPPVRPPIRRDDIGELRQRNLPVDERIKGLTWEERHQRLRRAGGLLSEEQVQQREALSKTPTKRQTILASESAEERRRLQLLRLPTAEVIKPPIRPTAPETKTSRGALSSIKQFFANRQSQAEELSDLMTPVAERIKNLTLQQRHERLTAGRGLLSEATIRERLMRPKGSTISPGLQVEESERAEEQKRITRLDARRKGGILGKAVGFAKAHPIITKTAGGLAVAATIAMTMVAIGKGLMNFSRSLVESQRALGRYHPAMAHLAAAADRQRILLDWRTARATAGSATELGTRTRQMNEDLQPMREGWARMQNILGGAAASVVSGTTKIAVAGANAMVKQTQATKDLTEVLKAAREQGGDDRMPLSIFLGHIAEGNVKQKRLGPGISQKRVDRAVKPGVH